MPSDPAILFGPFRLDLAQERLWGEGRRVPLTPKAFAVLRHLARSGGRLVTKQELLDAVWPDTYVSDGALKVCITEIRKAIGDPSRVPRFIETAHRRGYRFVGPVRDEEAEPRGLPSATVTATADPPHTVAPGEASLPRLIGRDAALASLQSSFASCLHSARQLLFVTGEAGIGKTALVEAFVHQVDASGASWGATGQCVEHFGGGEPYLPVLDALARLCRRGDGDQALSVLRRCAPTWLVQMPVLLEASERELLQRELLVATRERMLREVAEAVEALAAVRPLILVLEDLHWSDHSTLEMLSFVARRRERSRLMLIATYRPVEVIVARHPLRQIQSELQVHGRCTELPLEFLKVGEVGDFLAARLPEAPPSHDLARTCHRQTAGNPLFLSHVVEYARSRGWGEDRGSWDETTVLRAIRTGVPESLREIIALQVEGLTAAEQQALEAASVTGAEFSAASVAAALEAETSHVEEVLDRLSRNGQFLRRAGVAEWPDGTLAGRYEFTHGLYPSVLRERLSSTAQIRLHRRIGERLEAAYGAGTSAIAAELAVHFENGRDDRRALTYIRKTAELAIRRHANHEAVDLLRRGIDLLAGLPDGDERARHELALQSMLGPLLIAMQGNAAAEVERTYTRARRLCEQLGEAEQLFSVLFGLRSFHLVLGEVETAHALGEELLRAARKTKDVDLLLEAHVALASTFFFLGAAAPCQQHAERGLALYSADRHRTHVALYGLDPGVFCHCRAGQASWLLGRPTRALERLQAGLALARDIAHPYSLGFALNNAAWLRLFRGEPALAAEFADEALELSRRQGFTFLWGWAAIQRGSALAKLGRTADGLASMRDGFARLEHGGGPPPSYLLTSLAEAHAEHGDVERGLAVLASALDAPSERFMDAERHRLRGELLLAAAARGEPARKPEAEAERSLARALEIARAQAARSLELRAATGLAKLWTRRGRTSEARRLLGRTLRSFEEGAETTDVRTATALFRELETASPVRRPRARTAAR